MVFKFEYTSHDERERILNENIGLFLWEEQNIIDGNFLIFVDRERIESEPIPKA